MSADRDRIRSAALGAKLDDDERQVIRALAVTARAQLDEILRRLEPPQPRPAGSCPPHGPLRRVVTMGPEDEGATFCQSCGEPVEEEAEGGR